eukprot:TRINITY_DN84300_c0_g1_i1.p1 TRINITY_DN84300_c0_g1~~TRINITY_DN84300_c0_g1_i1.p1  ORF type:complete len:318 (+),score=53.87 TRINITY_DN84300_c0_g1_i1:48-956(+)
MDDIADVTPTDEELDNLALAGAKLWDLDENRLTFGEDFQINIGSGTSTRQWRDASADPLFEWVKEGDVFARPTYKAFRALLDNYTAEVGVKEVETRRERQETWDFLRVIMDTKPMQYVHKYMVAKGVASSNIRTFKKQLYDAWFDFYKRGTWDDSCGFEHVFCGEVRRGQVIGFHNWIQFYIQEKLGNVDYRGYIYSRRGREQSEAEDPTPNLITIKFAWDDDESDPEVPVKSVGSSFIGVSPEYEFALYSLCFFCGGENNRLQAGEYTVNVRCYHTRGRNNDWVGTAFPMAVAWDEDADEA